MSETRKVQTVRVLEAFLDAPGHRLTTGELHSIPWCVNPRARVSQLRQLGHVIEVTPIAGTDSSTCQYKGLLGEESVPELKFLTTILLGGHPTQVWI